MSSGAGLFIFFYRFFGAIFFSLMFRLLAAHFSCLLFVAVDKEVSRQLAKQQVKKLYYFKFKSNQVK